MARRIRAKVELDPRLPTGSWRLNQLGFDASPDLVCGLSLPVCVGRSTPDRVGKPTTRRHLRAAPRKSGVETNIATELADQRLEVALSSLEQAYRRLVIAADLPAPLRRWDPSHGSPAVTWKLLDDDSSMQTEHWPIGGSAFESEALVCRSGVATANDATLEREAYLCIGEAIAMRLDAAESPRSRSAFAKALWWEFGRPGAADTFEIERVNAQPYRAAVGRDERAEAASTAQLFEYLEHSLGTAAPFALVTGLFAVSGQPRTKVTKANARYVNEPDWLDVIRESLEDNRADFAHRVNAFAAARAQLGNPDGPLGHLAWAGKAAKLRADWDIRVSSLPRRVASNQPIEPLGSMLVRLDVDVPTKDLSLAIHVEWEPPVPFTWAAVKLDAQGNEMGRIDFAYEPRVTTAEKRIMALDGTRTLLILGTNLGGIDAAHLLDPDHAPFEPHGCTVYVVKL
ncbi:MAG TPA: hypothetical protein VIV60_27665 [Polyangiaceae bacterium]